jgi:uncharacterized protein YndB with AHSA1/START domain
MSDGIYRTSVRIDATPAEVFPYLTDPALLTRWMGDHAELEPLTGGGYTVDIDGVPVRGRFLEVSPPDRLVFSWGVAGNDAFPAGSTTVEITLTPDGASTMLELVHRDLPPDELAKHDAGWGHFLERLAIAATGSDPGPDPWAQAGGSRG